MKKIIALTLVLCITVSLGFAPLRGAENVTDTYYADILHELGLLKGSNIGYELDREPTRIEGLIMLIRLLGQESEALADKNQKSVFKDVPSWAVAYTNFAYQQGLTSGINKDEFGTNTLLTLKDYTTFALRALGYSDKAGDFTWEKSIEKAKTLGVIGSSEDFSKGKFTRGMVVKISFNTLLSNAKDGSKNLSQVLVDKGTLDATALDQLVQSYRLLDYGAAGDGSKDDSNALIKLLASASENAIIDLDSGNFNLGGKTIDLPKAVKFKGPGKIINGKLNFRQLKGFTFEGIQTENFCISIVKSSDVRITKSSFSNVKEDVEGFIAVKAACSNVEIVGNHFKNIEYISSGSTYGSGIKVTAVGTTMSQFKISDNTFELIHGPAAIWFGGNNSKLEEITVSSNVIHDTESFGIEIYQYEGKLNFVKTNFFENTLYNIGAIRKGNFGNGASGIYNNIGSGDLHAYDNDIRNVLEVGIEGYYTRVENNYIEDTGADQLYHPIDDSSGIYATGPLVIGNTIVNPGFYGGIHKFGSGSISGKDVVNNTIMNVFEYWKPNTKYKVNALVVTNGSWYKCVREGVSGSQAPSGKVSAIKDGEAIWDYKKPFAQTGITLHAVTGLDHIVITDNHVINFSNFAYLSDLNNNIKITGNIHEVTGLIQGEKTTFLAGYGNRKGETITTQE